jgi:hypothetical protein
LDGSRACKADPNSDASIGVHLLLVIYFQIFKNALVIALTLKDPYVHVHNLVTSAHRLIQCQNSCLLILLYMNSMLESIAYHVSRIFFSRQGQGKLWKSACGSGLFTSTARQVALANKIASFKQCAGSSVRITTPITSSTGTVGNL